MRFVVLSGVPEGVYGAFVIVAEAQSELKWRHLKNALEFSVS